LTPFNLKQHISEYRQDPLSGRWVIIAEERANRPNQFDAVAETQEESWHRNCPFCPGHEKETPEEIDAIRPEDSRENDSRWLARVVPNRFPAITRDCPWNNGLLPHFGETFFFHKTAIPGYGAHEVLIESPRHLFSVTEFDDVEILNMFRLYQKRLQSLRSENHWGHVLIFKNVGAAAGASLSHTHSQLMAMPFVPPPILNELRHATEFRENKHRCYWCDMIKHELSEKVRVVAESEHFLLICPFACRFPMEISIFPKEHVSHFESLSENRVDELAFFVRKSVQILEKAVYWTREPLSYNMILKSAPFQTSSFDPEIYHFHLTILPSLAKAAGFEWGTGLHINPISPETAATKLREFV